MAVFKSCLQNRLFSPLFALQQVRHYPRWSHRRPVKVFTPEEYENLQKQTTEKRENEKPSVVDAAPDAKVGGGYELVERIENVNKSKGRVEGEASGQDEFEDFGLKPVVAPKKVFLRKPVHKKEPPKVDMFETVIDNEGNFIYSKMKNKDIRITSLFVNVKSKKAKESMLVEGKRLIKEALLSGCKLQYLLFSRLDDIEDMKNLLPKLGAKLYKMPYREMQAWSELTTTPGVMAIFKIPDLTKLQRNSSALPLTIVCDNVREPGNLGAILRTGAGVGCQNILLTKGCVNLWDFKVLRSACGAHFRLPVEQKLDFTEIRERIDNSTVFIADNNGENSTQNILPIFPYIDIEYKLCDHITLIVGGETEGISEESFKIATELNGCRVKIPLSNDVESLNSGTALGVIAFEIKRQFLERNAESVEENSSQ